MAGRFTRILVPTDFNPASDAALACAKDIADRFGASVTPARRDRSEGDRFLDARSLRTRHLGSARAVSARSEGAAPECTESGRTKPVQRHDRSSHRGGRRPHRGLRTGAEDRPHCDGHSRTSRTCASVARQRRGTNGQRRAVPRADDARGGPYASGVRDDGRGQCQCRLIVVRRTPAQHFRRGSSTQPCNSSGSCRGTESDEITEVRLESTWCGREDLDVPRVRKASKIARISAVGNA